MKPHIDGWTNTPRDEGSGPQSRDDFLEHADAATKFSLAPLVEAINESIQGLRGQEFGPPRRDF